MLRPAFAMEISILTNHSIAGRSRFVPDLSHFMGMLPQLAIAKLLPDSGGLTLS